MGPLAVLPSHQRKGIGSMLMNHSIEEARRLGYRAIIIFGDPEYYHRFGFSSAKQYGIQTSWGADFEEFMALELYDGALDGISGRFYEDPVFKTNEEELEIFEREFLFKEKHVTETQLNPELYERL